MAVDDRLAATLREAIRLRDEARAVNNGGTGGASGGSKEDPLKARVDFLQIAFLWLAGALVTAVIGVVAIAVTLTNVTNTRLDRTSEGLSGLNREIGEVSIKVSAIDQQLDKIDQKLERIEAKLDKR